MFPDEKRILGGARTEPLDLFDSVSPNANASLDPADAVFVEILGGGNVVESSREDEWHHVDDGHEMWQESVVLCWWDFRNHIDGNHRIGHHPNHRNGPQARLTNNFFAADRVYKRCEFLPLRA